MTVPQTTDLGVLLVTSNKTLQNDVSAIFSQQGFSVTFAENYSSAMDYMSKNTYLSIITENSFADNSTAAMDLADRVARDDPERKKLIPVIIIIARDNNISIAQAFSKGVEAVFMHPFSMEMMNELFKIAILPRVDQHEKRKFARSSARFVLDISIQKNNHQFVTYTDNIGQGGMYFLIKEEWAPDIHDLINFKLHPYEETPIDGAGTVTWSQKVGHRVGCGIKFTDETMLSEPLQRLINMVKTNHRIRHL